MKLEPRNTAAFLRNPGTTSLVLLHGDDEGLIRERSDTLTRQVAGSLSDPFRTTELTRDRWGQIPAEMASLSMVGGRRVVRVRDATDTALPFIVEAMAGQGSALLIIEAPGLARGKLRSFAEASAAAVALASYPEEGAALRTTISNMLAEHGICTEPDALVLLVQCLGGDRSILRGEIEKLMLWAGPAKVLDAESVRACLGYAASGSGDDALLAMAAGDVVRGDEALEAGFADGLNGVAILRMTLTFFQKLHQARLRMEGGLSADEAIRAIRPPVFYKNASRMSNLLRLWTCEMLTQVTDDTREAELASKQTGGIPELLTRQLLYGIARRARRQSGLLQRSV